MKSRRTLLGALFLGTIILIFVVLPDALHGQDFYTADLKVTVCNGLDCGDVTPPMVPTGLAASSVSDSQINLSWNASTDPDGGSPPSGVAGYNLYRDAHFLSSTTGTSYSDTGLTSGTLYSYRVNAFDAVGNTSNQSGGVSTTTSQSPSIAPDPSLGAPSGTLPADTAQAVLSLVTDIAANCRYGTVPNVSYGSMSADFSSTGGTTHSSTISGLSNGSSYTYYVRCESLSGTADTSDYIISFAVASPVNNTAGGGGGGASSPTIPTSVSFSGLAYPNATVTLLKDGVLAVSQPAGPDARFNISLSGLAGGVYTFSVIAKDGQGRKSVTYSFTENITSAVGTLISGIFLPPTIGIDKISVKRGDPVTIFGQSIPNSSVKVSVHSTNEISKTVVPDANGQWSYVLNSSVLEYGNHSTQAYDITSTDQSSMSTAVQFSVGTKTILAAPDKNASAYDLDGDGRVNLVDLSIMSYWFKRPLTPAAAAIVDLNHDGKVDLKDFSIMAYNWTG